LTNHQSQGICPYCKSAIINAEELKICPGCDVPHHEECWQHNGGCTTFACDGKRRQTQDQNIEDYTFDDLAEEYSGNKMVINIEDLQDEGLDYETAAPNFQSSYQNSNYRNYSANAVQPLFFAGLIGGFITWAFAGRYFNFEYYANYDRFEWIFFEILAFSVMMGGLIGACLGSVEGITSKVPSKITSGIIIGFVVGVLGAAAGVFFGQIIFGTLDGGSLEGAAPLVLLRTIFWGLVGLFIGLGQGISAGGKEKAKNGLIGGIIGGFVGGFLFELFFTLFETADLSALIAIAVFGGCIGTGIGMVQEYRKEAWFRVIKGATTGKEYIIQGDRATIGSHPKNDITLIRDSGIEREHAKVMAENNRYSISAISNLAIIRVNNIVVSRQFLNNGDIVNIGSHVLIFHEKRVS